MSDVVDLAQAHELVSRGRAIGAACAVAEALATPAPAFFCEDCGHVIPDERRRAAPGATRCLFCQEAAERRLRTHVR